MTARQFGERHSGKITMGVSGGVVATIVLAALRGFYMLGQADNKIGTLEKQRVEDMAINTAARVEARQERRDLNEKIDALGTGLRVEIREGFKRIEERIDK